MTINTNNIFVDTNVLVGAIKNLQDDDKCLKYLFSLTGKKLFVSSLSIAQMISILQKHKIKTDSEIREITNNYLTKFHIIPFSEKDIKKSLLIKNRDMEDNIQFVLSAQKHCYYFVTNNKKDYVGFSNIQVIKSKEHRIIKK